MLNKMHLLPTYCHLLPANMCLMSSIKLYYDDNLLFINSFLSFILYIIFSKETFGKEIFRKVFNF